MAAKSRSRRGSTNNGSRSFSVINLALLLLFTVLSLIITFLMYTYNFLVDNC